MKIDKRLFVIVAAFALIFGAFAGGLLVTGNAGAAPPAQNGSDDTEDEAEGPDVPITGEALDKASAAALDFLGQGRVTGTEVGDEEGYFEVEVTLDNGRQVDVHLDKAFNILGQEADGNGPDD